MAARKQTSNQNPLSGTEAQAPRISAPEKPNQPEEVAAIRSAIKRFLDTKHENRRRIGSARCGVYAFYDYDGEPIYIGQTYEGLGARIGRHLTNQRTDAVAMNVLDPFEVASIKIWLLEPFAWHSADQVKRNRATIKPLLDQFEYCLYVTAIRESAFKAVLNEKQPTETDIIELPAPYEGNIIPDEIRQLRKHPDIRIARRASTIAGLARVISERRVTKALRKTLLTQARRLESLASERLADFATAPDEETESVDE